MQLPTACLLVIVTQLSVICHAASNTSDTNVSTSVSTSVSPNISSSRSELVRYERERQLVHWLATEISHGVFLYFKWSVFARITKCIVDTVMQIVAMSQLSQYTVLMSLLYKKLHFTITYWFNHLPYELLQLLLQE